MWTIFRSIKLNVNSHEKISLFYFLQCGLTQKILAYVSKNLPDYFSLWDLNVVCRALFYKWLQKKKREIASLCWCCLVTKFRKPFQSLCVSFWHSHMHAQLCYTDNKIWKDARKYESLGQTTRPFDSKGTFTLSVLADIAKNEYPTHFLSMPAKKFLHR